MLVFSAETWVYLEKIKFFFLVNEIVVTEYEKEGAITNNRLSRYNISAKVFLEEANVFFFFLNKNLKNAAHIKSELKIVMWFGNEIKELEFTI